MGDLRSEHGEPIRDCRFFPGAHFMIDTSGMRKRIPLCQLRVGMYVAGIDCSWFRTPFLKHRFLVQTVEQIERLQRSNIHAVDIDPSKGLDVMSFPIEEETLQTISLLTSTQAPPASEAPPSLEMRAEELTRSSRRATNSRSRSKPSSTKSAKRAPQDQDQSAKPCRKSSSLHEPSAPTPHSWR